MTSDQQDRARTLHELHRPGDPVLLANVWDAAGARLVAAAGATALATASAGISWTLGYPDGDRADLAEVLAQTARIVRAAGALPVTADLESGFADTAEGVGANITALLATGAVGVNLEDGRPGPDGPLRPVEEAAARIAAARAAADAASIALFVNARTDVFLLAAGDPADRLEHAVARARAYLAAGADGIFVPGVADPATVAALAAAVPAPLNVLAGPGAPAVPELAKLGVARVSLGPGLARAAYTALRLAAEEAYGPGTYDSIAGGLGYQELNALLAD
ncbi:isocitrate lyase/phosphoenolpyruvate mutase family protein [Kitasatospora herbaricolor]|uniref:Isocitrate lyase/phosphoenolpyruvate mutase family protein n=1 Tax=Kitasatospora herbaricolor TaxID=68217 RepID=A0ABZ1W9G6_9ACTN|nr:isocitrate lyase/phosphoenolpyruvate mutase family protein [Kitasatospora herbaricolor]